MRTTPRLLHVFPGFGIGGAQVRFAAVANHLGRSYQHVVVSLDGSLAARERLDPAIEVGYPPAPWSSGTSIGGIIAVQRFLRTVSPDVLVTHNWGSMDWAIANISGRIPHIHIEDGFGPEERATQLPRRVLTRRLVLRRSTIVLPSQTLERIARHVWRLPADRLRYLPNGVDLALFRQPADASLAARFRGDGPLIATVAALRPEKNISRLLRAFARAIAHVPARLLILGDGPERALLEALAGRLAITDRIFFAGYAANPAPFYACCDLFALSSDTEQMPLSVLEAMASGLPVAATNVGDVRSMLSSENDAFVAELNDESLANSLRSLLLDPGLRSRVGAANRSKAERAFDQRLMFQAYADLFETVRTGGATGPASHARAA